MVGAIIGDIIGSPYEFDATKEYNFEIFKLHSDYTDDSVMTIATAVAILGDGDYAKAYREGARSDSARGYGGMFRKWIHSDTMGPYGSFGNGSAMRVSPVGWAYDSMQEVLEQAERSAAVTHNHPEGIKGAQATALAIYLARKRHTKDQIRDAISGLFQYNLNRNCEEIRPSYEFDATCQGTVPEAIIAFLDSNGFEDAIRLSVSLGGDADTMGAITGSIAHAFYREIPSDIGKKALCMLPKEYLTILRKFKDTFKEKEDETPDVPKETVSDKT